MAGRKNSGPGAEFDGTGSTNRGPGDAIDPATLVGSGDADSRGDQFDPSIHVGRDSRNADGSWTRKRGRKPGGSAGGNGGGNRGGNRRSRKAHNPEDLKTSIEALAKTLVIVHAGIAAASATPEMAIDQEEADLLANATANVLDQFDLKPDPKIQAVVGMIMAAGTVYGPRVVLIRARKTAEAKERKAGANGAGVGSVINPDGSNSTTTFVDVGSKVN